MIIDLKLYNSNSLKEKRSVIKSVMGKLKNKYNISVAEVDNNDILNLATIGIACVSNSSKRVDNTLDRIILYVDENFSASVIIVDIDRELIF